MIKRGLDFRSNRSHSLGVELELQLIDRESLALKSAIADILAAIPEEYAEAVKPELMQCYLEINSGIGARVADIGKDLAEKIKVVEETARKQDTLLLWSATHPFSYWFDQDITPNERYYSLVEKMQDTARRIVTFGMHVHVGVDSGDKAVMLVDRLMRYLPTLLALSVNSPFWVGRLTGLHSQRIKIMEQLPAAGLPPLMRNYSEYCWLVNHSIKTGFINSIREIWWDVRPHPGFGTIEVRICDLPPCLEEVLGLTALVQCLVARLSDDIDEGVYHRDTHPTMVMQNKWTACRYGLDGELVDPLNYKLIPARDHVTYLVEELSEYAKRLNCVEELNTVRKMVQSPTGADRQMAIYRETGDLKEVVRRLMAD